MTLDELGARLGDGDWRRGSKGSGGQDGGEDSGEEHVLAVEGFGVKMRRERGAATLT